ncbi:UDP-2,4-diacetamido-2,4,6-trideoxy-beta-L-altropyranose hydrolase [Pseudoalteromonas xiamenensis]|uniref:UDP-2,4-diacetamido-2,4, 6-trideoxy-beta-L-altropyranose hydrolase n=1 Tax=Pseudoalteromonas xiamenensis TaxID=882626 RepID=UPI0027E5469A|nr:UDP-2,4-diacetamido-2,4,6-trideoxy-beta-L-altropyranose hydrolase [Pseudoalteromonas xiamenensis]WMN61183.1 UDP-2,4-diacetamido-2,4,6-trideoxy-beta-L-altropyranose hydrolase [Pseudoalteromonas xiamenensis]
MLKFAFRVDASVHIGSGHVMRCLVLADELKKQGNHVVFYTRPQPGDLVELIKSRGYAVYSLIQPKSLKKPTSSSDYLAWLQVTQHADAENFLENCNDVDVVICDHYGIDIEWQTIVRQRKFCKIVVIDDLVRTHDADLIIDQTLNRNVLEYRSKNVKSKILAGTHFALLASKFASLRNSKVCPNKTLFGNPRLLITMGAIDEPNASLNVLNTLKACLKKLPLATVLLSDISPNYQSVKLFAEENKDWVTHIDYVDDMASLMICNDISIGAAGSTSWERACLGLPSILIPLADNQRDICENLTKSGAALSLELVDVPNYLSKLYCQLIINYASVRNACLSVCDGMGVERVVNEINKMMTQDD